MWGKRTEIPSWARILIVFGLAGAVAVSAVQSLRYVDRKEAGKKLREPGAKPTPQKPPPESHPPTLSELFSSDFPQLMKAAMENAVVQFKDGVAIPIKRQVYLDFSGNSRFVGFYVPVANPPNESHSYNACLQLPDLVQKTLSDVEQQLFVSAGPVDQQTNMKNLKFSGRALLYHQELLSIPQKA